MVAGRGPVSAGAWSNRAASGMVALVLALSVAPAGAQATLPADAPVWTDRPVKVDRQAQDFERLEAKPAPAQDQAQDRFTLRFNGRSRYAIIDSITFEEGGRRYRLADLDPVPSDRICSDPQGGRWACGVRARAALGGLITGRPLRCAPRGEDDGVVEVECRHAGRDVGEVLVTSGSALVAPDAARYGDAEDRARTERAGIWSEAAPSTAP